MLSAIYDWDEDMCLAVEIMLTVVSMLNLDILLGNIVWWLTASEGWVVIAVINLIVITIITVPVLIVSLEKLRERYNDEQRESY
jgi:hypothetical protein